MAGKPAAGIGKLDSQPAGKVGVWTAQPEAQGKVGRGLSHQEDRESPMEEELERELPRQADRGKPQNEADGGEARAFWGCIWAVHTDWRHLWDEEEDREASLAAERCLFRSARCIFSLGEGSVEDDSQGPSPLRRRSQ